MYFSSLFFIVHNIIFTAAATRMKLTNVEPVRPYNSGAQHLSLLPINTAAAADANRIASVVVLNAAVSVPAPATSDPRYSALRRV